MTIEEIKHLGKNRNSENLFFLLELFNKRDSFSDGVIREIVSSIGRQNDLDIIYEFLVQNAFGIHKMELVYQMFRTALYKSREDDRYINLVHQIMDYYDNEIINKMYDYFQFKKNKKKKLNLHKSNVQKPLILIGDSKKTLNKIDDGDVNLIFTSPPYYNAKEYSDYHNYNGYLQELKSVFTECHRVLQDGRFIIVNVSPVITSRPGREFASIRYPIHYDLHSILVEIGFEFIDEIIWMKPEPSVPNRIGGFMQTKKPLMYKPNCITESLMVYRKKASFLLDENIKIYVDNGIIHDLNITIHRSNVWEIPPSSDKNHPAIFPLELCRRVLQYYSYKGDVVLDPFGGIGTFGTAALEQHRIPILCEINRSYVESIKNKNQYEIR